MEVALALRNMGLDPGMLPAVFDFLDEVPAAAGEDERPHYPTHAFLRDTKAMKNTQADVMELPDSYHFVVDMPGLRSDQIHVQIEDDNILVVGGERRGRPEKEGGGEVKYLRMERRLGKLLKKFVLQEDADKERVRGTLENGVLTVVVPKIPPPEPRKPRVVEVKVVGGGVAAEVTGAA